MFQIGRNTFYDQKSKIPMKIPEFKRFGIGIIAEFCGIPSRFPNKEWLDTNGLIAVGLMQGIETKKLWDLAHANVFFFSGVMWHPFLE